MCLCFLQSMRKLCRSTPLVYRLIVSLTSLARAHTPGRTCIQALGAIVATAAHGRGHSRHSGARRSALGTIHFSPKRTRAKDNISNCYSEKVCEKKALLNHHHHVPPACRLTLHMACAHTISAPILSQRAMLVWHRARIRKRRVAAASKIVAFVCAAQPTRLSFAIQRVRVAAIVLQRWWRKTARVCAARRAVLERLFDDECEAMGAEIIARSHHGHHGNHGSHHHHQLLLHERQQQRDSEQDAELRQYLIAMAVLDSEDASKPRAVTRAVTMAASSLAPPPTHQPLKGGLSIVTAAPLGGAASAMSPRAAAAAMASSSSSSSSAADNTAKSSSHRIVRWVSATAAAAGHSSTVAALPPQHYHQQPPSLLALKKETHVSDSARSLDLTGASGIGIGIGGRAGHGGGGERTAGPQAGTGAVAGKTKKGSVRVTAPKRQLHALSFNATNALTLARGGGGSQLPRGAMTTAAGGGAFRSEAERLATLADLCAFSTIASSAVSGGSNSGASKSSKGAGGKKLGHANGSAAAKSATAGSTTSNASTTSSSASSTTTTTTTAAFDTLSAPAEARRLVLLAAYAGVKLELRRQHLRLAFGLIAPGRVDGRPGGRGTGENTDTRSGAKMGSGSGTGSSTASASGTSTGSGTATDTGAGTGPDHRGGGVASWFAVARGTPAREWVPRGLGMYRDAE